MYKNVFSFIVVVFMALIFVACDNGTVPSEDDFSDDSISGDELVNRMVTTSGETFITGLNVSNMSGVATIDQEIPDSYRALGDTGNVTDFVDFGTFTLLRDVDGEVFYTSDNSTVTSLNTVLGATELHINSAQTYNNYLFIGGDRTLFRVNDDLSGSVVEIGAGNLFSGDNAGSDEFNLFFQLTDENNIKAWGDTSSMNNYEYVIDGINVTETAVGTYFEDVGIMISAEGDYDKIDNLSIFDGSSEVWFLQDNANYFTNGRYDVDKIENWQGVTIIPKTSTILQNWYVHVYDMHDTDRWYAVIDCVDESVAIYNITDGLVVSSDTSASYSGFVDADGLVKDFWILENGSPVFTDPGLGGNAGYTEL
jgi:hypothetical protein